jgi:hypothetical protein
MDNGEFTRTDSFFMINKASLKRHEGWPLDSLSIRKGTNKYFVDSDASESKDNIFIDDYRSRIIDFLVNSLGLLK